MKNLKRRSCLLVSFYLLTFCFMIEGNVFTSCDFEDGFCGWTNVNWSRTYVQSPLDNTGPVSAYHGNYYIYSHGREIGHNVTATLESNGIPASKYCLLFNYHIQGSHVEKLEVKLNDQSTAIWYQDTDQGEEWKCAIIDVTISQPDSRIRFISRTGKTEKSSYDIIGLDNIKLVSGACNSQDCDSSFNVTSTTAQPLPSTTTDSLIQVQKSTETETSWFETNLPYLVGVPVAVFFVSFVVISACIFHSHKESSSRRLPAGIVRGPHRADRLNDRYRDDPTNHRARETGNEVYYSEPDTDTYDYVDVVRDPNSLYLDVIPDSSGANGVQNGSHPADVSPKPGNYYNDENPYCEPVKATKDI